MYQLGKTTNEHRRKTLLANYKAGLKDVYLKKIIMR